MRRLSLNPLGRRSEQSAPVVALAIGLTLTIAAFFGVRYAVDHSSELAIEARAGEIERSIDGQLAVYSEVVWGVGSLFAGSEEVTREEFGAYIDETEIFTRHPELTAMGFARRLTRAQRTEYEESLRGETELLGDNAENFAVFPAGDRPLSYVIDYIEPRTNAARTVGYDIFSEPVRSAAVRQAVATGRPAATGPIQLITNDEPSPGVLILLPIGGVDSLEPTGVAVLVFDARTSIGTLFDGQDLDFELYDTGRWLDPDVAVTTDNLLFDTGGDSLVHRDPSTGAVLTHAIEVAGRRWDLHVAAPPVVGIDGILPAAILIVGIALSLVGSAATLALARSRDSAVQMRDEATSDLRMQLANRTRAKDLLTRALDRAQLATRAKSRFLANMSHEIRTPMNSVIGFTGILLDESAGPINEQQRAYLERIEAGGNHLVELINQILDLSKIESGALEIEPTHLDLAELVRNAVTTVHGASKPGVTLHVEIPPGRCHVRSDQLRLRQVLINLIGNALKFTEAGSVWVRLVTDATGRPLRVEVEDTGSGISQEDLPTVFEAFTQADNSAARKHEGSGLGLAISKQLIGLMDGHRITAESTEGVGSTFTVHFGAAAQLRPTAEPGEPTEVSPDGMAPVRPQDAPSLVLIRNPNSNPKRLVTIGARAGFDVLDVKGAGNALGALEEASPDAIVLAIPLSEIMGWQLLPLVRANPETFDTPIVLVAGGEISATEVDHLAEVGVGIVYDDSHHDIDGELGEILASARRTHELAIS